MDESRAEEDEEFAALAEPLPDQPVLRPLRHWASLRPVRSVLAQYLAPVWFAVLIWTRPSSPVLVALMVSYFGVLGLVAFVEWMSVHLRAQASERTPQARWNEDHAWDERGETRSWFARIAEASAQPRSRERVVAIFMLVVVFVLARSPTWSWSAAAAGVLVAWLAWRAWLIHGAGDAHVSYTKFPYHPGETVTLHFGMSDGGAQFRRVEFSLFHVREFKGGWLGMQRGTGVGFRGVEHHPPGLLPGPDFDVEVSFDVPADAPGTCLSTKLPRYWVLEVRGVTSAGPYVERFLVPIYARPSAPAASGGPETARDPNIPA